MRRTKSLASLSVAAVLFIPCFVSSGMAKADCLIPGPAPTVPSGLSATTAEMHSARDAIQTFVKALEDYQTCVNALVAAPPKDTSAEVILAWKAQSDAAIDAAHELADGFAGELKKYKARGLK